MTVKKAPPGLQHPGRRFWKQVTGERDFTEGHDLARLFMAARCLDEIADDETTVQAEGRYVEDRFGQKKEHPAAAAIRANKMVFIKIIRELALDLTVPEARPPRQY
jgi:hypothetical protein